MSSEAVSFYLENIRETGALGFYYDFNHWSGAYLLNTGSLEYPAYSGLSGRLVGDLASFTGEASGSGSFSHDYIEIENTNSLKEVLLPSAESKSFTYLVSQKKVDNSCGTIFSNYNGLSNTPSGWEIGINNANQLYFMYQVYTPGGERARSIKTLNVIPAAQNWYGVSLTSSYLSMGRYLPENASWETQRFSVMPQYINNSNDWRIGSGEYGYSGYMDKFIYLNEGLPFSEMEEVIKASYQDVVLQGEESEILPGALTGYSYFPTGETGIIGSTGVYSGTITLTGTGRYTVGDPLYGDVLSGNTYYTEYSEFSGAANRRNPFSGSGYLANWAMEDMFGVITGLNYFETGYSSEWTEDLYQTSGISGTLWTGSGSFPLYDVPEEIVLVEGETGRSGNMFMEGGSYYNPYVKDTISYLGPRSGEGDFCELTYNLDVENLNKRASRGFSPSVGREVFYVDFEYLPTEASLINIYQNGVFQATGLEVVGDPDPSNILNPSSPEITIKSGNFILVNEAVSAPSPYYSTNDEIFYDVEQSGESGRLYITGENPYDDSPFSEIPMQDSQIFFNGQKIYSGINWDDSGGEFNPIGGILSILPEENEYFIYEARPDYSGINKLTETGENMYDISDLNGQTGISGENFVYYINGIKDKNVIIYSTGVSLLRTGVDVMINSIENNPRNYYYISNGETLINDG